MKIYPVVHLQSSAHAAKLSEQAFGAGADGVFLIDHQTSWDLRVLDDAYRHVRAELGQSAWIGVNYLASLPSDVVNHLADMLEHGEIDSLPDAIWTDDAARDMTDLTKLREERDVPIKYFGGVAFKYTPTYTDNPKEAVQRIAQYGHRVDIVTTSGPGTGHEVNADKVAAMKKALGDRELALASGVSVDNIEKYRKYVTRVLAASSIETESYSGIFIPEKLRDLVQAVHQE